MRWLIGVLVLVGCGGSTAAPDAMIDADGCGIIECRAAVECRGGVVTSWIGTDSPCDWGGVCPSSDVECTAGCDVDGAYFWGDEVLDAVTLCAETPAKQVGDPCPCLPTRAVDQGDGTVAQTYLACEGGVCVEAAAPVVDGWLAPCVGVVPPSAGFAGWVHTTQGDCLVDDPCVVRTIQCSGDWQCPEGASCDDAVPNPDGYVLGICRPGPRGSPIALGC